MADPRRSNLTDGIRYPVLPIIHALALAVAATTRQVLVVDATGPGAPDVVLPVPNAA